MSATNHHEHDSPAAVNGNRTHHRLASNDVVARVLSPALGGMILLGAVLPYPVIAGVAGAALGAAVGIARVHLEG